ncbi:1,5-anhydro-D-fructose reductase [Ixodes scapularis]|uniref:1,5-anhydro-D-fructose reductase n=1 Tax=Ixodes scapularis TaxID=6945 RepID=UPI001C38DC4D|nr:1,5-anhydro-D-fructose reductase [Ixodes scapularis]
MMRASGRPPASAQKAPQPSAASPQPHDFVQRRKRNCVLMNNGVWIPMLGLATCQGEPSVIEKAVETAITAGYRHIDTAYNTRNEAAIGNALRKLIASGRVKREELFIVTKLPRGGNRREKVKKCLLASLKKLQVNFVDLYLIHFPVYQGALKTRPHPRPTKHRGGEQHHRHSLSEELDSGPTQEHKQAYQTDILDTWKGMEDAANQGLTRSIGLCNFNREQISRILAVAAIKPANLQVECHAYLNQKDLQQFCSTHSISFTAYAPLGSPAAHHASPTTSSPSGSRKHESSKLLQDSVLKAIAERHGKSPAQVLIRWLLQRGVVVLPRSTNAAHIHENFQVFDFELTEADMRLVSGLNKNIRLFTFDKPGFVSSCNV